MKWFPAFFDHPTRMRFVAQEEDEIIELLLRQHFITNVPWILAAILLSLVPSLIVFIDQLFGLNMLSQIPPMVLLGATIMWYMLITAYVLESFLHWYFNIYIVTNIHLVDVNFFSLLNRSIVETRIKDVESSSSNIKGIIGSLFNFGDVIIETAAKQQSIGFTNVPKPDIVSDRIQDLQAVWGGTDN